MAKKAKKISGKNFREPQGKNGKKLSMKPGPERTSRFPSESPAVPGSKADAALAALTKGKR